MQSIGERLEEARKRKGITIREAAEATKIRGDYLNSFESNTFKINIPDIYIRGFLRSYADYLNVNSDQVMTDYNAHLMGEGKSARRENREFFGRLELQQPIISEEEQAAPSPSPSPEPPRSQDRDDSEPISIWDKFNVDKEVAIKIGIAGVLAVAVLIVIIWGFVAFLGSEEPPADSNLTETPAVAPAAGATRFTLVAKEDVRVEVKQVDGDLPLFFAVLPQGQEKELTAIGSIRINYSDAAALSIRIGQKDYQMRADRSSIRITPATILKQQQEGN